MHLFIEPPSDLEQLSASQYWPDYIITTSGYDFRNGQVLELGVIRATEVIAASFNMPPGAKLFHSVVLHRGNNIAIQLRNAS